MTKENKSIENEKDEKVKPHSWEIPYVTGDGEEECETSFELFTIYLNMGPNRSLKRLSLLPNVSYSYSRIRHYASVYKWRNRIRDKIQYDMQQQTIKQEELKTEGYKQVIQNGLNQFQDLNKQRKLLNENLENGDITTKTYIYTYNRLMDSYEKQTSLFYRAIGEPFNINDTQSLEIEGELDTNNQNINYDIDRTSDEFFEEQLKLIDKMVKEHDTKNNKTKQSGGEIKD